MIRARFFVPAAILGAVLYFGSSLALSAAHPAWHAATTLVWLLSLSMFGLVVSLLPEGRAVVTSAPLRVLVGCHLMAEMLLAAVGWGIATVSVVAAGAALGAPAGSRGLDALPPFAPSSVVGAVGVGGIAALAVAAVVRSFVGTWTTLVVLRFVRGARGRNLLGECLSATPARWLRGFGALAVGHGVPFVAGLAAVPMVQGSSGAAAFACGLLAVAGIAWNLMTMTLLLEAVGTDRSFWNVIRSTVSRAWQVRRSCAALVVVQVVLVGSVVVLPQRYHVGISWLGGYSDEAKWYGLACTAEDVSLSAILLATLAAASLVLSIAIKLRIAKALARTPALVMRAAAASLR